MNTFVSNLDLFCPKHSYLFPRRRPKRWIARAIKSVGCLSFLTASTDLSTVVNWIVNIRGSAGLLIQVMLHVNYIRGWQATKTQGIDRCKPPFARRGRINVSWISS
jgi:amino acid permease